MTGQRITGHGPDWSLAHEALAFVISDGETAGAFLAQTGLAVEDLRARIADPELLAAVLDFILAEDFRVLEVARACGTSPKALATARATLPGGDTPEWT